MIQNLYTGIFLGTAAVVIAYKAWIHFLRVGLDSIHVELTPEKDEPENQITLFFYLFLVIGFTLFILFLLWLFDKTETKIDRKNLDNFLFLLELGI